MEVDKVADEVTDMEVDKVTDMKIPIEDLFTFKWRSVKMIFWSGTRQELIWRKTMVTTAVRLEPPNISGRWSMSHYQGLQLNIEYLTWYLWLCICFCNGVVRLCIVYLWLYIWYFCLSCIWNFTYDADHRYAQCPFSSICWKSIWEARSLYRKVGWIDDHKEVFCCWNFPMFSTFPP